MPTQTFTSSGSWTFPVAYNPGSLTCSAWGEGGNGAAAPTAKHGGAGGGGGEFAQDTPDGTPGSTVLTITIGTGGTSTNTTVTGSTNGKNVTAHAGGNGSGQNTPGSGGTGSTNATHNNGGGGGTGGTGTSTGGGGGGGGSAGSGSTGGTGGNGGNGTAGSAGSAGTGTQAGAAGGAGTTANAPGGNGTAPGGAGAGGTGLNLATTAGGSGAAGQVVLSWTEITTTSGGLTLNLAMSATGAGGNTTTSGAMTLNASMSGTAAETFSSTGAMTLNLAMNGTAGETFSSTASMSMSSMHMAATALYSNNATGGLTLNLAMSATDSEIFNATGGPALNLAFNATGFQKIPFPVTPLGIKIELLLNGTWTDITNFVYQRQDITITRGRQDESQTITPSTLQLTLNNRDGRFTPRNTTGAYYPFVTRNTNIRVHVQDLAKNGAYYNGFRFYGEVSSWPPKWDQTGTDVYAPITASGIMRRLQQNLDTIGAALERYYTNLNGTEIPLGYWPCDDASGSTQFAQVIPNVPATAGTWTGSPTLAANNSFGGSDSIAQFNSSEWTFSTGITGNPPTFSTVTYSTPGTYSYTVPNGVSSFSSAYAIGGGGGGTGGFSGTSGGDSSISGSGVTTVLAHGGTGANGGTGSTNTVHHNGGNGGGGGGEYASESTLSVTSGQNITIVVGAGGAGGNNNQFSNNVTFARGGTGGGSSGGAASAGNDGSAGGFDPSNLTAQSGGSGGTAVSPGGAGGDGGDVFNVGFGFGADAGDQGATPGGGGGNSSAIGNGNVEAFGAGGNGGAGQAGFSWSSGSVVPVSGNVLTFLLDVPSGGATANAVLAQMKTFGNVATLKISINAGSTGLVITGFDGAPSQLFTGTLTTTIDATPLVVRATLSPNGTSTNWKLEVITPGAGSVTGSVSGTQTSCAVGAISEVDVNPAGTIVDTAVGHVVVQYVADSLVTVASAAGGYNGERAGDRFTRLCTEEGIGFVLVGNSSDTPQMGPQENQQLVTVLQHIEDADRGQLFEPRTMVGLGYRTRVNLQNQSPGATFDYSLAELSGQLEPTYDDQLSRNDITLTRLNGSSVRVELDSGAMSTLAPPNGIGRYSYQLQVNLHADSQLANEGQWILDVGTVDEERYPQVTVDLSRSEAAGLFDAVPSLDIGDYFKITNPPAWLPTGDIKQLAYGYQEVMNAFKWIFSFNAVPESPFEGMSLPTW